MAIFRCMESGLPTFAMGNDCAATKLRSARIENDDDDDDDDDIDIAPAA